MRWSEQNSWVHRTPCTNVHKQAIIHSGEREHTREKSPRIQICFVKQLELLNIICHSYQLNALRVRCKISQSWASWMGLPGKRRLSWKYCLGHLAVLDCAGWGAAQRPQQPHSAFFFFFKSCKRGCKSSH